jgi:hypothetical protein
LEQVNHNIHILALEQNRLHEELTTKENVS